MRRDRAATEQGFHKWQDGTQGGDTCILSEGSELLSLYRDVSKKV